MGFWKNLIDKLALPLIPDRIEVLIQDHCNTSARAYMVVKLWGGGSLYDTRIYHCNFYSQNMNPPPVWEYQTGEDGVWVWAPRTGRWNSTDLTKAYIAAGGA